MQPSNILPKSPGVAAIGDSTLYARADHVHPQDDAKLDKSGGTMTGPLVLSGDPAGDLEATTKQYVDNHTSDVVLYIPQTLTDEQKTQARGNINAAPDGFGLGNIGKLLTPEDNLDEVKTNGWYIWERGKEPKGTLPASIGQDTYATCVRVWGNGAVCYQESADMTDGSFQGSFCTRTIYGSKIYPWEYINPPMVPGVEYRTTERYIGKPVYVKMVDCGSLPNAGYKAVNIGTPGLEKVIEISGCAIDTKGDFYSIPATNFSSSVHDVGLYATGSQAIAISTQSDRSNYRAYVKVKYTKTIG